MTKRGSSFGIMRVVLYLRERVSIGFFLLAGVIYFFRDVVRILCIFVFFLCSLHYPLVHQSCDHLLITYIVLISYLYMMMCVIIYLHFYVLFLFSLYTYVSLYCMLSFISVSI